MNAEPANPFVPVADAADVPDPGRTYVEIDDQLIVLVHAGGQFYAIDDVCTHDGGPLGEGPVDASAAGGPTIACPRHFAKFDLATGKALTMPAIKPTRVHEVRVENGKVLVRLST